MGLCVCQEAHIPSLKAAGTWVGVEFIAIDIP